MAADKWVAGVACTTEFLSLVHVYWIPGKDEGCFVPPLVYRQLWPTLGRNSCSQPYGLRKY